MAWCLNKNLAKDFVEKLKSGEINPEKLAGMTSKQRRAFFAKSLGEENAKKVNALFESKLLLKNQKAGMITWAKKIGNLKETARRDVISKINRLDKALNPAEEAAFLEDLVASKLGIDVTLEEAKEISRLAKRSEELRIKSIDPKLGKAEKKAAETDYGMS